MTSKLRLHLITPNEFSISTKYVKDNRKEMTFYSPYLPNLDKVMIKSRTTTKMIATEL